MGKFLITEDEKKEILNLYNLTEQGWVAAAKFAAHETNTGTGWNQGLQNKTSVYKNLPAKEIVKNLFVLSKTWQTTQNDLNKVKPIILKMKTQMTGIGSGNFLNLLSQIKTIGELSALVKNWKNISGDNKTLYQWLSEEYTISWDQILTVLEKNFKKYIVRKVLNVSTES